MTFYDFSISLPILDINIFVSDVHVFRSNYFYHDLLIKPIHFSLHFESSLYIHFFPFFFLKKKKRGNKESLDVIKLKVITTKGIRKSVHNNIKQGTWISGLLSGPTLDYCSFKQMIPLRSRAPKTKPGFH